MRLLKVYLSIGDLEGRWANGINGVLVSLSA